MIAVFPVISIYYVSIFYFQAMGRQRHQYWYQSLGNDNNATSIHNISERIPSWSHGVWLAYPISDILASLASLLMREEEVKLNLKVKQKKQKEQFHLLHEEIEKTGNVSPVFYLSYRNL